MGIALSTVVALLCIGLVIGTVGGMVGIGGGILVIPVLMFVFGFSQAKANGTSLAMLLPPIGLFAVMAYARAGNIDWRFAMTLALGFAVGAYAGAKLVNGGWINPTALRIGFALLLVYCAGRLLFRGGGAGAALETLFLMAAFGATYLALRLLGRRWKPAPNWGAIYRRKLQQPVEHDYEI